MKIYSNVLDVDLSYQNFGSHWLLILRGATEQIKLAFNGLFNLCATNGGYEFEDHLETVMTCWSSEKQLRQFFTSQYFAMTPEQAEQHANDCIAKLKENHESFVDVNRSGNFDTYSTGQMTAERPDEDMKDAILAEAFKDKSNGEKTEKSLD